MLIDISESQHNGKSQVETSDFDKLMTVSVVIAGSLITVWEKCNSHVLKNI